MNDQLKKALGSFTAARPLERSAQEALEDLLEKAIADPTNGGTLVPVHIVDKNGHHTVRYHAKAEIPALQVHPANHYVSQLAAGHRFTHPKNGPGTITKIKGHDGKGYELATEYDSGKKATAYVHNVELHKPDHAPINGDNKPAIDSEELNHAKHMYVHHKINTYAAQHTTTIQREGDEMKKHKAVLEAAGVSLHKNLPTQAKADKYAEAYKEKNQPKRVPPSKKPMPTEDTMKKTVVKTEDKTRSGKDIVNGKFPHQQDDWTADDHEDAVDYHKSQHGKVTINGETHSSEDFVRSHSSAADSKRRQEYEDKKQDEFLDSTLPIGDPRYNEQRLKRSLKQGTDKYKGMKNYLMGEHGIDTEDLNDDENDDIANLLSGLNSKKVSPAQAHFALDTLAIENNKRAVTQAKVAKMADSPGNKQASRAESVPIIGEDYAGTRLKVLALHADLIRSLPAQAEELRAVYREAGFYVPTFKYSVIRGQGETFTLGASVSLDYDYFDKQGYKKNQSKIHNALSKFKEKTGIKIGEDAYNTGGTQF